jgi:hypothetical protein
MVLKLIMPVKSEQKCFLHLKKVKQQTIFTITVPLLKYFCSGYPFKAALYRLIFVLQKGVMFQNVLN